MKPTTREFKRAAAEALGAESIQSSLSGLYDGLHQARITAGEATPNWEAMRDRGRAIKAHTIANLDHYLEMAERNVTRTGGKVFFARDADAASRYVLDLARSKGVKLVTKGKSMLSEEMGLNQKLVDEGIEPVETDLGEYIIQLAEETPFHIIAPAIHKTKREVSRLFQEKLDAPWYDEPTDLTQEARRQLREKFIRADMGITGANFLVAETGTLVLVTNEGNGRMCTSMPRVHVAIMGMEKMVPSMQDLSVMLPPAHPVRHRPADIELRHLRERPPGGRRRGRPGGVPSGHSRQRAVAPVGRPRSEGVPLLHTLRRLSQRLPGLPEGRRPRIRMGILRPHRRGHIPRAHRPERGEGPSVCVQPVRRLPRGMPSQDRPAPHAAAPAQADRRGGRGRLLDGATCDEGVEADAVQPIRAWTGPCGRPAGAVAPVKRRAAEAAAPAALRLDPSPHLPGSGRDALQEAMEEAEKRGHQWYFPTK